MTTRSKHDVYTAPITLHQDRGPDGGAFVPFHMPFFEKDQIAQLANKSFGQNIADILELFFSAKLSGWDVDMALGRYLLEIKPINYRVLVAELWHNMDQSFIRSVRSLSEKIHPDGEIIGGHSEWSEIAIRIAVLFGIFGEAIRRGQVSPDRPVNVAVSAGSFIEPMSVWYARQMGLPIDHIICGCNENGAPWELLHRGELDTGVVTAETTTPECDYAVHPGLERLISAAAGQEEALHFHWSCTEGATYVPAPEVYKALRNGMFAAVVSKVRVETIIPSVYRTNRYIMDPYCSLAYGALTDYRSRTGKTTTTLLLSEKSPMYQADAVARTMQISVSELKKRIAEV